MSNVVNSSEMDCFEIKTTQTDFGCLSELRFKPDSIVTEDFWGQVIKKDTLQKRGSFFCIQYLHDTPTIDTDPKYLELVNKISQLFLHIYFSQEAELTPFHNPRFRIGGCWNASALIANYAQKAFPELQVQLLGIRKMSSNLKNTSEEVKQDPVKGKYLCHIPGIFHVLGYGSNNGLNFAFDSLGIDFLDAVYSDSEKKTHPLTQVFVANDNKKLQDILNHRYVSQENWFLFKTTENFHHEMAKPLSDY